MTNNNVKSKYSLNIGWLYPDLMSTYGDRGNILVLKRRCELRGIGFQIQPIDQYTNDQRLTTIDLIFGGGSQDREQEIVMRDLKGKKQEFMKQRIEQGVPALFVCGSPQLMGKYYEPAVGQRIEGLGIFDMETINPGPDAPRCIGNIAAEIQWQNFTPNIRPRDTRGTRDTHDTSNIIVGFENHGGRTYLGKSAKPFATVIKGYGNNGKDGTEGVVYKNAIGCYFHGPLLPKNPHIADYLIQKSLEVKYKKVVELLPLDDNLERKAQLTMLNKIGVNC